METEATSPLNWQELAEQRVANAPNDAWRGRGKLIIMTHRILPLVAFNDEVYGQAEAVYVKFEKPDKRPDCRFIGFVLAALVDSDKGVLTETSPVHDRVRNDDFTRATWKFNARRCPECHKFDTTKRSTKLVGPECARITYRCKCGYVDYDAMD
jgi:hypothetical protein